MAIPSQVWNKHFPESNAEVPPPQFEIGESVCLKLVPERRYAVVSYFFAYARANCAAERWVKLKASDGRPAFWKQQQLQRV